MCNCSTCKKCKLTDEQIIKLTVKEGLKALECGKLTSERWVKVLFNRTFQFESKGRGPGLNSYIFYNVKGALKKAKKLDKLRRKGCIVGLLHGVPMAIKDSNNVAGMPCTAATPSLRKNIPSTNALVVQSLIDAGVIILGKTNLAEMSFALSTTNDTFAGVGKNPYNLKFIPGGSSGGSAAAIAAMFTPAAILEDTIGSIRCPSMCCGTYGLRPTTKRYPQKGVVPIANSFDADGPGARTVEDLILLDTVITGDKKRFKFRSKHLRIGIPRQFYYEDLSPDVNNGMDIALQKLLYAGVTLVEVNVPSDLSMTITDQVTIAKSEFRTDLNVYLVPLIADPTNPLLPITAEEVVDQMKTPAMKSLAEDFLMPPNPIELTAAKARRVAQRQVFADYFADNKLDAIFVPSAPETALPIAFGTDPLIPIFTPRYSIAPFNALPSLALPVGLSSKGLPIGAEVCGPHMSDRKVLFISKLFQKILGKIPGPNLK